VQPYGTDDFGGFHDVLPHDSPRSDVTIVHDRQYGVPHNQQAVEVQGHRPR
jgi:hypothetical protein